jgi:hypothetical protein
MLKKLNMGIGLEMNAFTISFSFSIYYNIKRFQVSVIIFSSGTACFQAVPGGEKIFQKDIWIFILP